MSLKVAASNLSHLEQVPWCCLGGLRPVKQVLPVSVSRAGVRGAL